MAFLDADGTDDLSVGLCYEAGLPGDPVGNALDALGHCFEHR